MNEMSVQRRACLDRLRSAAVLGDKEKLWQALGAYLVAYEREVGELDSKMAAYKSGRAVQFEADECGLTFCIERHPGWNRAQRWRIDYGSGEATLEHEWGVRRAERLDLEPIVSELADAIRGGTGHKALRRSPDGRVALVVKEVNTILSADAPARRTVEGRFSRLATKLQEALNEDWQLSGRPLRSKWTFEPRLRR